MLPSTHIRVLERGRIDRFTFEGLKLNIMFSSLLIESGAGSIGLPLRD